MIREEEIQRLVDGLTSHSKDISFGKLESELEQLFSSEEKEHQMPDGLPEAMTIASDYLRQKGYKEMHDNHYDRYEKIQSS